MSLDDFEELLPDKPADEKWELIGGRVVRMMVGARWEHNYIIQNLATGLRERFRAQGSPCRTLTESFWLRDKPTESSTLPDVIVHCRPLEPGASALDDPTVLVEVMSEGSRARDRFENGRSIRSCRACGTTCLSSATGRISRSSTASATSGRACASATDWPRRWDLPAVDASVPLAEIYRDGLAA